MTFPKKSPKGPGSRPRVLKRHQNGRQRVPKWSPGVSKFNPKAKKNVENLQQVAQESQNGAQGATMEPQGATLEPQGPTNAKHTEKAHPNCKKHTHQKLPQGAKQRRKTIYPQTPNQPKKQRGTQRNKQSNKHTHAQELRTANTNTNSRGRVLAEGDVDPAAGSPKEPFRL